MANVRVLLLASLWAAVKLAGSQGDITAVATGANVTLTCGEAVNAAYGVTWLKDGSDFVESLDDSRYIVSSSQLTITEFHASDHEGFYSCLVNASADGAQRYRTCPVQVVHASIVAHGFQTDPVDTTATVGELTVLRCQPPHSVPPPTITWKKEGLEINPDLDPRLTIMPSGNLYISNTTLEDSGTYQCEAVNPVTGAKRRSQTAMLAVTAAIQATNGSSMEEPYFKVPPQNTTAKVGDVVVMECAGGGTPTPVIDWSRHSTHFPHNGEVLHSGALRFNSVLLEDAGRYHCRVSNDNGLVEEYVYLDVKAPPEVVATVEDPLVLEAESSHHLTFRFRGSGPMTVSIYHNGELLVSVVEEELGHVTVTHMLPRVTEDQSGVYQAIAANSEGCSETRTSVTVTASTQSPATEAATSQSPATSDTSTQSPATEASTSQSPVTEASTSESEETESSGQSPVTTEVTPLTTTQGIIQFPVLVVTPIHGLILREGEDNVLYCSCALCSEDLYTKLEWKTVLEGGTEFVQPSSMHIGSFSLLMVHFPGTYTCRVTQGDNTFYSNPVIVSAAEPTTPPPPPPVLDVMVTNDKFEVMEGETLKIDCKASGGSGVYQIAWLQNEKELQDEFHFELTSDGGLNAILCLEPVRAGDFICRVTDTMTLEQITFPVSVSIRSLTPTSAPRNVTVTLHPNGNLLVEWLPLEGTGIVGYKVTYDLTERVVKSGLHALPRTSTSFSIPLSKLDPVNDHTILVWAYSLGGDGPAAVLNLGEILNLPSPPTTATVAPPAPLQCSLFGSTAVTLSWEGPGENANIMYSCSQTGSNVRLSVPMVANPQLIKGLLPNCVYDFTLHGPSEMGVYQCSVQTQSAQVNVSIEVERLVNGSIKLLWQLPKELQSVNEVSVNWGKGFIAVETGLHYIAHFEHDREYKVTFRFSSGSWTGYKNATIPSVSGTLPPEEEESSGGLHEVGLIYGVIFGGLLVACSLIVLIILVLKYIQMSRRDEDKETSKRELERQEFKRMSIERISNASIKKSSSPSISSSTTTTSI